MKMREVVLKGNGFYSMAGAPTGDSLLNEEAERIAHKVMDDKKILESSLPFCDFIF
jgi:hypothetical protein